jgi:hypothetical protein
MTVVQISMLEFNVFINVVRTNTWAASFSEGNTVGQNIESVIYVCPITIDYNSALSKSLHNFDR